MVVISFAASSFVICHRLVQERQLFLVLGVVAADFGVHSLLLLELLRFVGVAVLALGCRRLLLGLVNVFPRVESLQLSHQELLLRMCVRLSVSNCLRLCIDGQLL